MAAPHSKDELRRSGLRPDPIRDQALRERLAAVLTDMAATIAFVWPLGGEPDLRPLMNRFSAEDRRLALPVIVASHQPLAFRSWRSATSMEPGMNGTSQPAAIPGEPSIHPDIILVPTVAFDRRRNRLGRGGGFYDRTLANYPHARAIGFAYATAEIASVPAEPHDRPLHLVVTDRESF